MRMRGLVFLIVLSSSAVAQDSVPTRKHSVLELRANYPTIVDMQYGYKWLHWLSTDAIVTVRGAFGVGITLQPIPYLFAQAQVGKPYFNLEGQAEDAPIFEPDVLYGLRAGFRIGFRNQLNFLTVSSGIFSLTDNRFCSNCGFRFPNDFSSLMYRVERRYYWMGSVGLGWEF